MIEKEITDRVVVIGTSPEGRGGVATVIAGQRDMMETFHFITIHRAGVSKLWLPLTGLMKCLRYVSPRYKVVHVHSSSFSDFYRSSLFMLAMKALGKRVVMHMHGAMFEDFYASSRRSVEAVSHRVDAIATVSRHFVNFMNDNHLSDNVYYLPNSIPGNTRATVRDERRADGEDRPLIYSFFGAIDDRKGIFETVEALGLHKERFKGRIELHIGGTGDMARMQEIINRYDIADMVVLLGWLDAEGKSRLLAKSDVFVHPSNFESFGISILEAMDYSLPVITTATGGIPDLVTDGVNGIVVPAGDVEAIAAAMGRLMDNPEERLRFGSASAVHARDFHTPEAEKRLREMYLQLLDS